MKKLFIIALLGVTSNAFAATSNHAYIGSDFLIGNNTELDNGSGSIEEGNDLGVGIYAGYNFDIRTGVDLGLELEYQHLGKAETADGASAEGGAIYINARPKFSEEGNNLYSAILFGVGVLQGEVNGYGLSESESKISYQVGLEIGYMFGDIDASLGYRYRSAEISGVDVTIQGATAGLRYNF